MMSDEGDGIGGIVLAAGASSRMGCPKALLPAGGQPLAVRQAETLAAAGCRPVVMVLGCDGERIARELSDERVVQNPDWPSGRVSSLQAGLRALGPRDGYVILPVDTVGVEVRTIQMLMDHADREPGDVVRPAYHGRPGRVVWISRSCAESLLELASRPDLRLDTWLGPRTRLVEVDDAAILNNVNTPEEWAQIKPR